MRKNLIFTPLMVALVSGGATICAQDTNTAVMTGRVTSQGGQVLQGVRVLIESPALLGVREVTTDARGQFRVPLLPNGEFTVTYSLQGYLTRKLKLRLIAGQTGNANTSLTPVGVQSVTVEITTTASVAQTDKTDTVVQTSYSSDFLEKVVGRSFDNIAMIAPGLSATNFGNDNPTMVRGGSAYGSIVLINGASIKDMWNNTRREIIPLQDLIESASVIQSPLNSRYGNTDSGILSVVTSRGSNAFGGSVRLYSSRGGGYGSVDEFTYPRRDGTQLRNNASGSDVLSKRYEITLKGPIWKDHVTFSYGADLQPSTLSQANRGTLFYNNGNGTYGRAQDMVGTFYKDPDNGIIIRKPELWMRTDPISNLYYTGATITYNQFTIFAQINPMHQLEWNYNQRARDQKTAQMGAGNVGADGWLQEDTGPWDVQGQTQRNWSLAYKGIIGTSGILEARMGNSNYEWYYVNGRQSVPLRPIMITSIASRFPINPNGDLNDLNNYYSNGYVSAFADSSSGATSPNPYAGRYRMFHNSQLEDMGDSGGTKSYSANYQHLLNTGMGTHMIDVGLNSEKFSWNTNQQQPYRFHAAGQIAFDLSDVAGLTPALRDKYQGKYIVFNPTISRLSDVDSWGVNRYGIPDKRFIDSAGNVANTWLDIIPQVRVRFGIDPAFVYSDAFSYYLNDMWSINDHHSFMAGVRVDNIKVYDMVKEVVKYTQPTFRAEYKWDINGDQSRLLSVSWGQFHNNPGAGTFRPAVQIKNQNSTTWFWTGAALSDKSLMGLAVPYLVGKDDILNLDNYTYRDTPVSIGSNNVKVDPNFKAMISTETSVGFRRSLKNGGYWKLSFINRTWQNDFDLYPGEEFLDSNTGRWDIWRIMRNSEGTERTYKSIEAEWDFPINERTRFGGSYTYARFMSNTSWETDQAVHWRINSYDMNLDSYWDGYFKKEGGRNFWNPVSARLPEHTFRLYLTFDLSSGKLDSSLTFFGNYKSADFQGAGASGYYYGFPMPDTYPHTIAPNGDPMWGQANDTPLSWANWMTIPGNTLTTASDSWDLSLRYLISVPLGGKLAWHTRITVNNPFNHRGLGNWYPGGSAGTAIVPYDLIGPTGDVEDRQQNNYWNGYRNVWRAGGSTFDGNGLYQSRMGGRSFSFETGLKF